MLLPARRSHARVGDRAICSAPPDLDVIGFRYGIRYGDFWGHRGFTHSLVFAALLAGVAALSSSWPGVTGLGPLSLWAYFFLSTASHGFLDAMTDGGLGVAFFSPFNNRRYFFSWTPIRVSPIGIGNFLTGQGFGVVRSELLWIWLPAAILAAVAWTLCREGHP